MDADSLYNMFLNNYLRIFYTSFPHQKINERGNNYYWITTGIRISSNSKKHLYFVSGDSDDINLMHYLQEVGYLWLKRLQEDLVSMADEEL
jgi:hypothetical protein